MTKKIFYTLFFFALLFWNRPIFAYNGSVPLTSGALDTMVCDAPAPDSFRVTSIASDLVSLGWIPAWSNATQTIEVILQDSSGGLTVYFDNSVPGDAYILSSLDPGIYKVIISTNCLSGETSIKKSEVQFSFKIIDLIIAGRIPKDPVAVEDCGSINYMDHEWVGFKVTEIETGVSNMFEFALKEGNIPQIKRVEYNNPIVAVDEAGIYPTFTVPLVKTNLSFQMDDLNNSVQNNLVNIGFVVCSDNFTSPPSITLCVDYFNPPIPWKPNYKFRALTAESVITTYPNEPGSAGDKSHHENNIGDEFIVQSPFGSNLNVFIPEVPSICGPGFCYLFNLKGQKILSYSFGLDSPQMTLPVGFLTSGYYYLQIETACFVKNFKVVKTE